MTAAGDTYLGTVTRVEVDGRPYVLVPRRAGAHEYGPCLVLQGLWTPALTTEAAAGGAGDDAFASHVHGLGVDLTAGDRVLVTFALDVAGELAVVLGRL
jgi:hypothetical protein